METFFFVIYYFLDASFAKKRRLVKLMYDVHVIKSQT